VETFLKIVPGGERKPIYSSKPTHLQIIYYRSLSTKKIKSIVHTFPNIIHLDFEGSMKSISADLVTYPDMFNFLVIFDKKVLHKTQQS